MHSSLQEILVRTGILVVASGMEYGVLPQAPDLGNLIHHKHVQLQLTSLLAVVGKDAPFQISDLVSVVVESQSSC